MVASVQRCEQAPPNANDHGIRGARKAVHHPHVAWHDAVWIPWKQGDVGHEKLARAPVVACICRHLTRAVHHPNVGIDHK
jgi:hypothetical protein